MNRKYKNDQDQSSSSSFLTQTNANSGRAGQSSSGDRHASPFFSKKDVQGGLLHLWRGLGQQVNDNVQTIAHAKKPRFVWAAALAMLFVTVMSIQSSTIVTQTILHTDSEVLSAAMDINPDAVGFLLNQIDVGE